MSERLTLLITGIMGRGVGTWKQAFSTVTVHSLSHGDREGRGGEVGKRVYTVLNTVIVARGVGTQ